MSKDIKVVELFAGVGGFRIGLEKASPRFKTIWANQWEPSTRQQHAFDIYNKHFCNTQSLNVNDDISKVRNQVPNHDLLVGGFPCQDYSVAHGNRAQGIQGKKGVLWWEIYQIIQEKNPKMILLENVDRLLLSPSKQRGRDFAIMLRSLNDLGYIVEWKTITASEYGFAQKRKRVFILGYKNNKNITPNLDAIKTSFLENVFPSTEFSEFSQLDISTKKYKDLSVLSDKYSHGKFLNSGISINSLVATAKYKPKYNGKVKTLKDILDSNTKNYIYLDEKQIDLARHSKNKKEILREKNGFQYKYKEGQMIFPDDINKSGRTMLTSEGTINRSSHFIGVGKKVRFLTAVEAERLNGFPDNWTEGKTNRQRLFFMGNALVVDIIEKIGKEIEKVL